MHLTLSKLEAGLDHVRAAPKDGGVLAIMSAYNRVRGTYATENRYLLTDVLRGEWGFTGYVQSDFWSARSAAASIHAGLDLEMPDAKWLNEDNLKAALHDTSLEIEAIDRALVRRFTPMFALGHFEWPYAPGTVDAAAHGARARVLGRQFAVLLKNEGDLLAQVICEDQFEVMETFRQRAQHELDGRMAEKILPFTDVQRGFIGDRYSENRAHRGILRSSRFNGLPIFRHDFFWARIPPDADYATQLIPNQTLQTPLCRPTWVPPSPMPPRDMQLRRK